MGISECPYSPPFSFLYSLFLSPDPTLAKDYRASRSTQLTSGRSFVFPLPLPQPTCFSFPNPVDRVLFPRGSPSIAICHWGNTAMSPSDHPESGVQDPNELELGATTSSPSSPQNSAQPQPRAAEPPTVPDNSTSLAENPVAAVPSIQAQSGDAAGANHPATSGESTAPVTATTSSTTTPPNDTPAAVAQPQNTDLPTMDTEEPKAGAELSEEQTEEVDAKEVDEPGPSLAITLLLITGARHPFAIDGKYLRKQSVNVEGNSPFAMSVYTLKELIWREWRSGKLSRRCLLSVLISDLTLHFRLGESPFIAELHSLDLFWEIVR